MKVLNLCRKLSLFPSLYPQALLQMELQLANEDYGLDEAIATEEKDVTLPIHKQGHDA